MLQNLLIPKGINLLKVVFSFILKRKQKEKVKVLDKPVI